MCCHGVLFRKFTPLWGNAVEKTMHLLRTKGVTIVWLMALLLACVNMVAMIRRAPIMAAENQSEGERAAQAFAKQIAILPQETQIALYLSPQKEDAEWFRYRLSYLVYPHRLEVFRTQTLTLAPPYLVAIGYGIPLDSLLPNSLQIGSATYQTTCPPANERLSETARLTPLSIISLLLVLGLILFLGSLYAPFSYKAITLRTLPACLALSHLIGMALLTWGLAAVRGFHIGGVIALPLLSLCAGKPAPNSLSLKEESRPSSRHIPLLILTLLGVGASLYWGYSLGLDWDGYAIWQLKAKAFFQDGNFNMLRDATHFDYAHLDYPLLLPFQTYFFYSAAQFAGDRIAQFSTFLFYLDLLVLFYYGVRVHLSAKTAWAGTALLATLPLAIQHATSGFADIPFASYLLAVTLAIVNGYGNRVTAFLLIGLLNTKNEGLMAGVVLLVLQGFLWLRAKEPERQKIGRQVIGFLVALVVGYLPWYLWKSAWNLHNDIATGAHLDEAPGRVLIVLFAWASTLLHIGPRFPCWGFLVGLLRFRKAGKESLYFGGAVWLLLGYTLIYLITPHDVHWHIQTSMGRLLLHIAPLLLINAALTDGFGDTSPHFHTPDESELS